MEQLTKNEIISYFENEIKQHEIILGGFLSEDYRAYIEKVILCYKAAIIALKKGEN